jgi:hypothetical protein
MGRQESIETKVVIGSTAKSPTYCPVAMRDCPELESASNRTVGRLVTDCREMSNRLELENTLITGGSCGALMLEAVGANFAQLTQEGANNA